MKAPDLQPRDMLAEAAAAINRLTHPDTRARRSNLMAALRYSLNLPQGVSSHFVEFSHRDRDREVTSIDDIRNETKLQTSDLFENHIVLSRRTATAFLKSRDLNLTFQDFQRKSERRIYEALFDREPTTSQYGNLYTYAEVVILSKVGILLAEPKYS